VITIGYHFENDSAMLNPTIHKQLTKGGFGIMKTGMIKTLLISIFVVMVVMGISTSAVLAEEKTIELKYAGLLPSSAILSVPVDEWGKRVAERTKGKVKLTSYHSQTLGKWLDFPKLAKSGLCDLIFAAEISPGFELLGAGQLPLLFPSQRIGMDAMYEVYRKGLLSSMFEDNGFKLLFFMETDPRLLYFSKKKVTSFKDLKGMKIRGTTPVNIDIIKALDATAVAISPADMYMALERGTVDGMVNQTTGTLDLRYYEGLKYVIWVPICTDVPAVAMNLKVWNSLPAEVRVAMLEVNEEIRYWYLGQYESDERYQEIIKEKGIEIVKVDQEERDYLNSKLEPVLQSWVEKMEAKGVPAKKVVDELKRVVKEY
jgi:TRAP-type C4-dicarboxylate transport system substrate-binding protein